MKTICEQSVWFRLIIIYSLSITIIYLYSKWREMKKDEKYHGIDELILSADIPVDKKIDARLKYIELKGNEQTWFEKGISTIGVFALICMTIVTSVQTIKSERMNADMKSLTKEMAKLKEEKTDVEYMLTDISKAILERQIIVGNISVAEKKILEYRYKILKDILKLNHDEIIERYSIAILLHEFEDANNLIEKNFNLLNKTLPADRISLAQYYYAIGERTKARSLIDNVMAHYSTLPETWKFRVLVLKSALGDNKIECANLVSVILKVKRQDAQVRIDKEIRLLNKWKE